jgi:hypothetical protein
VFGKVRTGIPLVSKTYPLEFAVGKFVEGIRKRSRTVHVPGWIGALKVVRWALPHVIEAGSRFSIPRADAAALADIQARGAEASSRATGAGGQADAVKASQR